MAASRSDTMSGSDDILTPDVLLRAHKYLFPWPKGSKIDWTKINERDEEGIAKLVTDLKPIWKKLSEQPVNIQPPSSDDPEYLEKCCGLVWILDQQRGFLKGTDQRWTREYFDPICEKLALQLYHNKDSPHKKETWLERGWSFDDFIARVNCLWAPLVHSEKVMAENWELNNSIRLYLRKEIEEHSGQRDPGRDTEEEDGKDLQLFAKIITGSGPPATDLASYFFWWLRIIYSHYPITNKFGRYPYVNDMVGRDFKPGELEWVEENGKISPWFARLDEETRVAIRKDVEAGTWTPLKLEDVTPVEP